MISLAAGNKSDRFLKQLVASAADKFSCVFTFKGST
jgi:hypothetical protein